MLKQCSYCWVAIGIEVRIGLDNLPWVISLTYGICLALLCTSQLDKWVLVQRGTYCVTLPKVVIFTLSLYLHDCRIPFPDPTFACGCLRACVNDLEIAFISCINTSNLNSS